MIELREPEIVGGTCDNVEVTLLGDEKSYSVQSIFVVLELQEGRGTEGGSGWLLTSLREVAREERLKARDAMVAEAVCPVQDAKNSCS